MKKVASFILVILLFFVTAAACSKNPEESSALSEKVEGPNGFVFSFTWGAYGESTYDSSTGKLRKARNATRPEKYITTMFLDEDELTEVYHLLMTMDIETYPDIYDPFDDPDSDMKSTTSITRTWIITVHTDSMDKTITCKDVSLLNKGYNAKSQKFIDACEELTRIITSTDEWESLPEYEFH